MEPANCMREVLRAASRYQNNSAQLTYLLRQLETLESISSRSGYIRQLQAGDQVELIECLTFLVDAVREEKGQLELVQHVIKILLNLSHDENVRKLLYETFSLCPPLAALVVAYSGLTDQEQTLSGALQLLQRVTYGHRIDYHQPHMEDLLKFLIYHILNATDSLNSPVLGTLANLCRNNVLVQSAIRNMYKTEMKKLLRTLCGFFENSNQMLVIFSLSVFTSLSLNESEGQKVFFEGGNVEQTLQTVFSIIMNGFKTVAWKYAADLLTDLLRHPQMQICVKKYRHLSKCMSDVLTLLAVGSEESVAELFEVLLNLCAVPSIRFAVNSRIFTPLAQGRLPANLMLEFTQGPLTPGTEPLLSCIHWAAQEVTSRSRVACLALDFLIDSCQDCICGAESSYPVHLLTPVFSDFLSRQEEMKQVEKNTKLVQLLTVLSSEKQSKEALGKLIKTEVLANLIEKQLAQNYIVYAAATSSLVEENNSKEEGAECVLLLLNLGIKLRKCVPGLQEYLTSTLREAKVMDFLALGLTSSNQEHVEISLRLLCFALGLQDACPDVVLCGSIACLNKQKQSMKRSRSESGDTQQNVSRQGRVLENKENRPLLSSTPVTQVEKRDWGGLRGEISSDKSSKDETSVESIMEPKDPRAEVSEVFEHHIKALQIKEEHLNNLLEAKSLALTQADRVIAQLRVRQASHSAEMKKLNSVLNESERRIEQMVSQMNEQRITTEKMQAQNQKQLDSKAVEIEAMEKENTELVEKCGELEERLAGAKQESKTLSNMKDALQEAHEILKEQYNVSCNQSKQLEEERKTLSKQLKEKDATVQKLSSSLQALQSKYNDTEKERTELEKEKDDMEAYVDKLRNQLSTSENSCRQLQQRTTLLEGVNLEQGEKLKKQAEKISELESELEKHNQIVSFINNMQLKNAGKK